MSKSKFAEANKKIKNTVVGGYQKIENTVVEGYQKVEDKFVDHFLRQDNETIKEAKERLNKDQHNREIQKQEQFDTLPKYSKTTNEIKTEIKEKYEN